MGYVARLGSRAPFLFLAGLLFGETRFGLYTAALAAVETAAAVAMFGLRRSLFKFMSEAVVREDTVYRAVAHAVALALPTAILLALAIGLQADRAAALLNTPSLAGPLRLLALAVPLIVTRDVLLFAIRFTREMRYEVVARSLVEPITLVGVMGLAYAAGAREHGLLLAYLGSVGAAAATVVASFVRVFPVRACLCVDLRWAEMRALVGFSGPTALYDLLILLAERVDIFLVTYLFSPAVVGIYGMAWQFSTLVKKIRQGFDPVLTPVVSQSIAEGDLSRVRGHLALVSRWILSVQMLLVLCFALYGRTLLGLMGGQFAQGALILTLLVVGDAVNGSLGVSELPLLYVRPAVNVVVGAALLVLDAALGFTLARAIGPAGAALGVLLAYAVINGLRILLNRRLLDILVLKPSNVKPLVAGAVAIGGVMAVNLALDGMSAAKLLAGLPVLLAGYSTALYLLGLEPEDRAQLARLVGRAGRAGAPAGTG